MSNIQWWLVTVNRYGTVTALEDGPHSEKEGANRAMYLINRLGLAKSDKIYRVAKIEVEPVNASGEGVNEEALSEVAKMVAAAKRKGSNE